LSNFGQNPKIWLPGLTRSPGLRTALSDKFLMAMNPVRPLSSRTRTPEALPGQVPASKWFQT